MKTGTRLIYKRVTIFLLVAQTVLAALALLVPSAGAEGPRLGVELLLVEDTYRDAFSSEEIQKLEANAAAVLADALAEDIRFLTFSAPVSNLEDRLEIRLGRADAEALRPVHFHLSVVGPSVAEEIEPVLVLFRTFEESIDVIESWESFQGEIAEKFRQNLNPDELIAGLFSKVVLARSAFALEEGEQWYWILPFAPNELGIDVESRFRVRAELEVNFSLLRPFHTVEAIGEILPGHPAVPAEFHTKIKARLVPDEDEEAADLESVMNDMRTAERREATEVRLRRYVPRPPEARATTRPSDLVIDEEGAEP